MGKKNNVWCCSKLFYKIRCVLTEMAEFGGPFH